MKDDIETPMLEFKSVDELLEEGQREFDALFIGSDWKYSTDKNMVSYLGEPYGGKPATSYDIYLDDMKSSAVVLDWIAQVNGKNWATAKVVGDLVKILDALLGFQQNYCSGGIERKLKS